MRIRVIASCREGDHEETSLGSPAGRPKRKPVTDAYSARLDQKMSEYFAPDELAKIPERLRETTVADFIVYSVIGDVIAGKNRVYAAKEIADRVEGKVPVPLMGVDGAPVDITRSSQRWLDRNERRSEADPGWL